MTVIRAFETHEIRHQKELSGVWTFSPLDGPRADESFSVAVPSCWESYPAFGDYRGKGRYTTQFSGGGNLRLVCKGVGHSAQVLLDGETICTHYGAYTPFDALRTGVADGAHTLEIIADNGFSEDSALHVANDYHSYGGITRPVVLEWVPDVFVQRLAFTPCLGVDGVWEAQMRVTVTNLSSREQWVAVRATLCGVDCDFGGVDVPASGQAEAEGTFRFPQAQTYHLSQPTLYLLKVCLYDGEGRALDDLIERVGFREVRVEGDKILFNGEPIRIKGFNRHEDHGQFGSALPFQAMDADLNLLLDLGANAVRTSHYPNDELFLDLCDEKGILVWEESHARGLSEKQMQNPNFDRQSADCIREMLLAHYNHPSIFIWGILNECASDTQYGRSCYERQLAQIRATDRSRPVTFASCKYPWDISLDLPDVVSFNIYPGWYHDEPSAQYLQEMYEWLQDKTPCRGKPFIVSEIGAGGIYGYHVSNGLKWSEEKQAQILDDQLRAVLSHPGTAGVFVWMFADCRVSPENFYARPKTMNNKGVVDEYRRRKLAYDAVKAVFTSPDYR